LRNWIAKFWCYFATSNRQSLVDWVSSGGGLDGCLDRVLILCGDDVIRQLGTTGVVAHGMTVFVDDMRRPARVGRITADWSHLYADSDDELHAFAARLGLKRSG
jgi:hypothetical protein